MIAAELRLALAKFGFGTTQVGSGSTLGTEGRLDRTDSCPTRCKPLRLHRPLSAKSAREMPRPGRTVPSLMASGWGKTSAARLATRQTPLLLVEFQAHVHSLSISCRALASSAKLEGGSRFRHLRWHRRPRQDSSGPAVGSLPSEAQRSPVVVIVVVFRGSASRPPCSLSAHRVLSLGLIPPRGVGECSAN